ncbi:TonB-dependent receptor [uncultured Aquimarina sp.]|uniref:TonB-dependent receptor n=1 Tax=uncultured Aquimarina sp. TaxID=575652 RepID=UPI002637FCED|nr:TonB-dependent receptor [uncultured Aquimarina sp.]
MRKFFTVIALFYLGLNFAQETGSIAGTLLDKETNNQPLPFANILIVGTTLGTSTDFDGKYEMPNVPVGNYTLEFSFTGYQTLRIPDVAVTADKVVVIDTGLGASTAELDEVVIKVQTSREREEALLLEQKNAVEIKQSIGAQELARKGVSDVAGAVAKTTGITKQEGSGNIYVRGLGDRYNSTTLNGLPIPSDNPDNKNISLDIFSTDIVQNVGISKTYNNAVFGDFSGGNVDIISKDYKGKGFLEVGLGINANTNAVSVDKFYLQDGPSFTGFSNNEIPNDPINNYSFDTNWNREGEGSTGGNFAIRGGKSFTLSEENNSRLNIFSTLSFDNNYEYNEGIERAVNAQAIPTRDLNFESYTYNTNTTFLTNLGLKLNQDNNIKYNFLLINGSAQRHREFNGLIVDVADDGGGFIRRSIFNRTTLIINQLLGKHDFGEKFGINWGIAYNNVRNIIPDRMQNILEPQDPTNPNSLFIFSTNADSENHRYFQELTENEYTGNLTVDYKFGKDDDDDDFKGKITLGYSGRFKFLDFEATQFNFEIIQQQNVDRFNLDTYFNQQNFTNGVFDIGTFRGNVANPLEPQTYSGEQIINAGFASVEYSFSDRLTGILGVRAEQIYQFIEWQTQLQPLGNENDFDRIEILPNISLKYILNGKQNLKFAASKTYTLPQFKERAPFQYEDVTQIYFGNPDLNPSTNYNVDLKWELFPESDELISVTGFGKIIQDPINDITVASSTNDISYVNTGDQATIFGAELEVRKNIFKADQNLTNKLSAGLNVSYMQTDQDLSTEKVVAETDLNVNFTNTDDGLTGASDLLINADLSYAKDFTKNANILATVSYNYFSDRIYSLGTNGRGNIVDKAVGTLDFILRSSLTKNLSLGVAVKNILDPRIERTQENPTNEPLILSYKKGLNTSFSLTYKF